MGVLVIQLKVVPVYDVVNQVRMLQKNRSQAVFLEIQPTFIGLVVEKVDSIPLVVGNRCPNERSVDYGGTVIGEDHFC